MANKDLTHIAFIIDRSGSMNGVVESTIKGFNEFMVEQRGAAGEAFMTVVLFDDRYEILHDMVNVKLIPDLDASIDLARGTTALRDAIGRTILKVKEQIQNLDEDDRPAKVLFTIITDGHDNASTDFDTNKLQAALTFQRDVDKWEFLFTGTDETLVTTAQSYGIVKGNTRIYENSTKGVMDNYGTISCATVMYRSAVPGQDSSNLLDDAKL